MRAYYFGYHHHAGHTFRGIGDRFVDHTETRLLPWQAADIDGNLQPGSTPKGDWRSPEKQPEGIALVHHKDGGADFIWTALSFWDRSGDKRGNSNSTFIAYGDHDFDAMVAIAKEHFPTIWERFTFEVVEHKEES
jgi:hypothetical protein